MLWLLVWRFLVCLGSIAGSAVGASIKGNQHGSGATAGFGQLQIEESLVTEFSEFRE